MHYLANLATSCHSNHGFVSSIFSVKYLSMKKNMDRVQVFVLNKILHKSVKKTSSILGIPGKLGFKQKGMQNTKNYVYKYSMRVKKLRIETMNFNKFNHSFETFPPSGIRSTFRMIDTHNSVFQVFFSQLALKRMYIDA